MFMIKRIKPLSESAIKGMVYQIRYLVNEKHVSAASDVYKRQVG